MAALFASSINGAVTEGMSSQECIANGGRFCLNKASLTDSCCWDPNDEDFATYFEC